MKLSTLYIIVIALLGSFAAQAQLGPNNKIGDGLGRGPSLAAYERKATNALEDADYYTALVYFEHILSVDSNNVNALRGVSVAALPISGFSKAIAAEQKLLVINPTDPQPLLRLGDIYYHKGEYAEAKEYYRRYLVEGKGQSAESMDAAQNGMENCDWAITVMRSSDFAQEAFPLDTLVNTEYAEYSPIWAGDKLYFSSYRFPFKGDRHNPSRYLVKIMSAEPKGDAWDVTTLDINENKRHTMHLTLNKTGDVMYYAVGEYINTSEIRSALYMRRKTGETWGPSTRLPASINLDGYTATEPNIGAAPGQNGEVLYFVSDRPGGKGKRDIWYSLVLPDGGFSEPANLSQLNTPADDVSPFYHSNTGTLYYSSAGEQTLGGFDVYKSVGQGGVWTPAQHLEPPVNSASNDVFFSLTNDAASAFFSSNRLGGENESEESCCYDLFRVNLVKPKMVAVTFHELTKDSLSRTEMRLFELGPGGATEREKIEVAGNYYPFSLLPGKQYMIVAAKKWFKPDTILFSTPKLWAGLMVQHLFLPPAKVELVTRVYDLKTKEPLTGATAKFIDLGPVNPTFSISSKPNDHAYRYPLQFERRYRVIMSRAGYTTDSTDIVSTEGLDDNTLIERDVYLRRGLDLEAFVYNTWDSIPIKGATFRLVEVPTKRTDVKTNPLTNNYLSFLDYGTRYRVVVSKPGYTSDSTEFRTEDLTLQPFESLKKHLYIHSLDMESYLPIRLYFDNDEPEKRTLAKTTTKLYSQTYFAYYPRKQEYMDNFTLGMNGKLKDDALAELDAFFEDSVKGEWNRLRFFNEVLYEKLKRGETVEITLKGFASPRAASVYNKNLTARRIMSVMNHFSDFDGGVLRRFVQNGQLKVIEEPNGEDKARPGVKDNIQDTRNSIYSFLAARERRVEIIGIEFNKQN